MIVKAIYHGSQRVDRGYHGSQLIFQGSNPIQFHVIEDDKLIIMGAMFAYPTENGLYLDCSPDGKWTYPDLKNGVLTITQAHTATKNGTTLEVR